MKFRCWQVISSRAVHTLPASGCLCPRSSITSTSSCKGTSLGLLERSGGWKAPEVGSILVSVIYRIQRSSRHCKTWQQGNQSPASCSSPVLGTKLSITARPSHDNAAILPLETRAGCGLELQHDAPGPGEEGKGQLAGMKTKQQQIKISTPQTKPKNSSQPPKTLSPLAQAPVSFGSGKSNPWLCLLKERGCFGLQRGLLSLSVLDSGQTQPMASGTPFTLTKNTLPAWGHWAEVAMLCPAGDGSLARSGEKRWGILLQPQQSSELVTSST